MTAAAANAEIQEAQNGSILCPNFHNMTKLNHGPSSIHTHGIAMPV